MKCIAKEQPVNNYNKPGNQAVVILGQVKIIYDYAVVCMSENALQPA